MWIAAHFLRQIFLICMKRSGTGCLFLDYLYKPIYYFVFPDVKSHSAGVFSLSS